MIARPPRFTLFPYATLSRSGSEERHRAHARGGGRMTGAPLEDLSLHRLLVAVDGSENAELALRAAVTIARRDHSTVTLVRSEEHTSELQSRQYLVCRLLLEK